MTTTYPAEQVQLHGQSSYSNFMREANRVIDKKDEFEFNLRVMNFTLSSSRQRQYDLARMMAAELTLATSPERERLDAFVNQMKESDDALTKMAGFGNAVPFALTIPVMKKTEEFKDLAHQFLNQYIIVQARTNLQFTKKKDRGEMVNFINTLEVGRPAYFEYVVGYNAGVPQTIMISPQMEFFCRGLYLRSHRDWDNELIFDARRGRGKSVLAMTVGMILSKMHGIAFSLNNLIFNETQEYSQVLLTKAPRYSTVIFDQAGGQVNAKSSLDRKQIALTNTQDMNRFHGLTTIYCWHDAKMLDKDVRERIATHQINIEERGLATVKGFNLNPHNKGVPSSAKLKSDIAMDSEAAQAINQRDALTIFNIPYLPLEKENTDFAKLVWNKYVQRKESAYISV